MTHDLWTNLNRRMFDYLDSVSLQCLVNAHKAREAANRSDEKVVVVKRPRVGDSESVSL
jgi:Rrf2 family transcriptional regulator, iron-sulfur cluster assembly transcription factor